MAAPFTNVYTSVGCNRTPHSLDWGHNGLICYAASNSVAIYDPQYCDNHGKLLCTAHEHQDRVNCVQWVHGPEPSVEKVFLSGSSDKTVIVWDCNLDDNHFSCFKVAKLTDINTSINSVDGIHWNYNGNLVTVISAVGDNKLCIWLRIKDDFTLLHTYCAGPSLILDCKIHLLPDCQVPIIACACDDGNVYIFNLQLVNGQLGCVHSIKISGHEDWVRNLAFTVEDNGDLLLASSSQDYLIRVCRISQDENEECSSALQSTQGKFTVNFNKLCKFKCYLETVLQGHENWVYGLHWQRPVKDEVDGVWKNPLRLLSCSMDKTMIIWGIDKTTGMWLDQVRVGEVGGNTLGLYGCCFGNQGLSILAHGYQGALHLWNSEQGEWKPGVIGGGHFGSVEDFIWDPLGEFIISVSTDQTSRLHAPWVTPNTEATWHEVSRPQVHGYDLSCITSLGRFRFASGAEEKVIRIFEAPRNFLENFSRICQIDESELALASGPQGASVPALGLSNKPVYDVEAQKEKVENKSQSDLYAENLFSPTYLTAPPTEETLLQNTLWPEIHKLYGHGYELFTLACDPHYKLMVSTSRAQQTEHAAILVWDLDRQTQVGRLNAHTLTVTQMAFSPDGRHLVSVSRDRTWAVHEKCQAVDDENLTTLRTIAKGNGGSRILWSCDWSPDSKYFVTGSRDKRVIVWTSSNDSFSICGAPLECQDSVTAVTFCHKILHNDDYVIAFGLDNGQICLYRWNPTSHENNWKLMATLNQSEAHHRTVKRLRFRPLCGSAGSRDGSITDDLVQLASCGADNMVKIFNVKLCL